MSERLSDQLWNRAIKEAEEGGGTARRLDMDAPTVHTVGSGHCEKQADEGKERVLRVLLMRDYHTVALAFRVLGESLGTFSQW